MAISIRLGAKALLPFLAAGVAACTVDAAPQQPAPSPNVQQARAAPWGFDLPGRNPAVRPGDDFFEHANGTWLRTVEIAPGLSKRQAFDDVADVADAGIDIGKADACSVAIDPYPVLVYRPILMSCPRTAPFGNSAVWTLT